MGFRRPTADESRLLVELAKIAGIEDPTVWVRNLRVRNLDDGGMGSLGIEVKDLEPAGSGVVICRAAVQFKDVDGVDVIASLNAREDGAPVEVDMWKTNFGKLIRIPDAFVVVARN